MKFGKKEKHPNWKGGRSKSKGYYWAFVPEKGHPSSGYRKKMFEHKIVMEAYLGRRLRQNEVVHHKNHKRDDNRIENLEVMDRRCHSRLHMLGTKMPEEIKAKLSRIRQGQNQGESHPQFLSHVTKEKIEFLQSMGLSAPKIAWVMGMSPCGMRHRMKKYGIYKGGRNEQSYIDGATGERPRIEKDQIRQGRL